MSSATATIELHLQAHFSRIQLPADLAADQKKVLEKVETPLRQVPHFELELIQQCKDAGVESVYVEDDKRTALLQMTQAQTQ